MHKRVIVVTLLSVCLSVSLCVSLLYNEEGAVFRIQVKLVQFRGRIKSFKCSMFFFYRSYFEEKVSRTSAVACELRETVLYQTPLEIYLQEV